MLQTRRPALSGNALKGIAILAMTLDHLTWTLWPGYSTAWWVLLLHLLGRVTAPIMWFFVVEGYHYTHDVKKYAVRLFALAVVSHFAYDFCFGIPFLPLSTGPFNQTGVVWSLAWGLMLLVIHDDERIKNWVKLVLTFVICAITFPSDWSCIAAVAILYMGQARGDFRRQMCWLMVWSAVYALVYFFFIDKIYALVQLGTCLAIPLLRCYDGTRGKWRSMGKLFYVYYPAHLALIGVLRVLLPVGPAYRGELTVAQFAENYNTILRQFGDYDVELDENGRWKEESSFQSNGGTTTVMFNDRLPQLEYQTENGVLTGIVYHAEGGEADSWISIPSGSVMQYALFAFAGAEKGHILLDKPLQEAASELSNCVFSEYHTVVDGVAVDYTYTDTITDSVRTQYSYTLTLRRVQR